jgi:hypothetical protein
MIDRTTPFHQFIHDVRTTECSDVYFEAQFPGMGEPEEMIVYPMDEAGTEITIQRFHRIGTLDLDTGRCVVTPEAPCHAGREWMEHCKKANLMEEYQIPMNELVSLRWHLKQTGSVDGNRIGALAL